MSTKSNSTKKHIHERIAKQLLNEVNESLVPLLHQMPLRKGKHNFILDTSANCPDCGSNTEITVSIEVVNKTKYKKSKAH